MSKNENGIPNVNYLIVERNMLIRKRWVRMLKDMGAEHRNIVAVEDAKVAWKKISEYDIDFIIFNLYSDENAEDSILDFMKKVRNHKKYGNLPFLVLSDDDNSDHVVFMGESGVDGCIVKPFSQKVFSDQINGIWNKKKKPSESNLAIAAAIDQMMKENFVNARKLLMKFLEKEKNWQAKILHALGMVCEEQAKQDKSSQDDPDAFREAESWYLKAVEVNQTYVKGLTTCARFYEDRGQLEKAIEFHQRALAVSPDNHRRMFWIGKLYLDIERLEKSKKLFAKLLKKQSVNKKYLFDIGKLYQDKEMHDLALEMLEKYATFVRDPYILNHLGISYRQQEKFDQALKCYTEAMILDPEDCNLPYNKAKVYMVMKNNKKAIESLEHALEIDGEFQDAMDLLESIKNK